MKPIDLYTALCLTTLIEHTPVIKYSNKTYKYSNRTVIATVWKIEASDNQDLKAYIKSFATQLSKHLGYFDPENPVTALFII